MHFVEQVGGVLARAADQLVPAAGVVVHVRRHVVHLALGEGRGGITKKFFGKSGHLLT